MKTNLIAALAALTVAVVAPPLDAVEVSGTGVEAWQADPTTIFDASDVDIEAFRWIARPVVVFADTEVDPAFARQIENLRARMNDLAERDVVVIVDTTPSAESELRQKLRPRGFMLVLIGKDGGVKLRKPFPWDVREISRSIDKMPMRRQEVRERREAGN